MFMPTPTLSPKTPKPQNPVQRLYLFKENTLKWIKSVVTEDLVVEIRARHPMKEEILDFLSIEVVLVVHFALEVVVVVSQTSLKPLLLP
jgi:hypothetical protein